MVEVSFVYATPCNIVSVMFDAKPAIVTHGCNTVGIVVTGKNIAMYRLCDRQATLLNCCRVCAPLKLIRSPPEFKSNFQSIAEFHNCQNLLQSQNSLRGNLKSKNDTPYARPAVGHVSAHIQCCVPPLAAMWFHSSHACEDATQQV